jgi:outer membrane biosynthesis protein TonB
VSARTLDYHYPDLLPFVASQPETDPPAVVLSDRDSKNDLDIEEASDRIYSKADLQVTRPVNLFPRFPPEPAGIDSSSRTILELTIAADGLVERVSMLTVPRNIHEFMLLSAAKAWRFEPARIGGRAVRFRQTMVLVAMP